MYKFNIAGRTLFSFGKEERSVDNANIPLTGNRLVEIISGGVESESGISITQDTSLNFSAVYCATRVIAESIAYLPLQIFKKTDKGRVQLTDHPLYYKLHDEPNNFQTAFTLKETMATRQCLNGNAYAYIERDGAANVTQIIPFSLDTEVEPIYDVKRSKIYYKINGKKVIEQTNIIHIPALSTDGIVGKSPIAIARESIGLGMAMQRFGSRFFGKGANPDFILEHPGQLSPQAIQNIKDSWAKDASGLSNSHKPRVLEEGMKLTRLSIAPDEAQFLESRKFQITEIARWFRLPPHMIGDLSNATFSNIEQQDIGFVKYSLAPWLKRWEQELCRKLLTEQEKKEGVFIEFNLDALLRGDTATRGEYYTKMIAARVLSPNEVRSKENMNHYEGGDTYENPNTSSPNTKAEPATEIEKPKKSRKKKADDK